MAHMVPSAAIFSPSVARIAASTAKDWNYVDSWLSARFHGGSRPAFERNPDTLKALLALAALNETADEERDLVARVEAAALHEQQQQQQQQQQQHGGSSSASSSSNSSVQERVLDALVDALSPEAAVALDAMASAAVELGVAYPEPELVGRGIVDLRGQALELEQAAARVATLQRYLDGELLRARALLAELEGDAYRPSEDLARQNLEAQRKIKAASTRARDAKDRSPGLPRPSSRPAATVDSVRRDEQDYLALLALKDDLEDRVRSFQGLPPETDLARQKLERLRSELRTITQRRDAVFESLVERETPRRAA